jgi:hypothetical protein
MREKSGLLARLPTDNEILWLSLGWGFCTKKKTRKKINKSKMFFFATNKLKNIGHI